MAAVFHVVSGWSLPLSLTVFSDSYPWWLISCCLLETWTLKSSCSVALYPDASQDTVAPEVSVRVNPDCLEISCLGL